MFELVRFLCRPWFRRVEAVYPLPNQDDAQGWANLVDVAREHDVLPLAAFRLLQHFGDSLPEPLCGGLRVFLQEQRRRTGRLGFQLRQLLQAMADAGIPVIPIKGPPLGRRLYGAAWLRTMRDLDLLVRDEDIPRAVGLLEARGFVHETGLDRRQLALLRRYAGQYLMLHPSDAPVEPHWLLAPRTLAFGLDHDRLWRRARETSFRGAPCLALTDEDTLLALCLHGAKDRWRQLKLVADVAFFLHAHPALDWERVLADAAADGCSRILGLGLHLAVDLLGAELPLPVARRFKADPALARLVATATAILSSSEVAHEGPYCLRREYWAMHERWHDRWAYALRTACQPRPVHYRRLRLPEWLDWGYYALKLPWDYVVTPALSLGGRTARP